MTDWPYIRIGELGRVVTGKTPSTKDQTNFGGPYPFITIPDLDGRVFIATSERTVSAKGAQSIKSSLLPAGSVMMSCIATVGRCGITNKVSFTNQQINALIPDERLEPRYAYYAFQQLGPELEASGGGGSTYINVSKSRFADMRIPVPDRSVQGAIAEILGSLDDKIELNRRMNETLEAMAQAIFRDWFVDFGPTRRKIDGATDPVEIMGGLVSDPDRAQELAELFPTELGEDGLPEGWSEKPIGDLAEVVGGSTPSTKAEEYWDDGHHMWATPKDLSKLDDLFLFDTERQVTDAGLAKIGSGLSPVGTVLLSSRAPIGYLAIADVPTAVNQGFIAIRPSTKLPTSFALLWCQANMEKIKAAANGSTFQEISKRNFRPLTVVHTSQQVTNMFDGIVAPMFELMRSRAKENRTFAATRDLLLPKLMSGEIRLRDAERAIEAVA